MADLHSLIETETKELRTPWWAIVVVVFCMLGMCAIPCGLGVLCVAAAYRLVAG